MPSKWRNLVYTYPLTTDSSNAFLHGVEFVKEEANARALAMEKKFAALPASAGVIFASVKAVPSEVGGGAEFHVRVGIARHLTEETGRGLIKQVLEVERIAGLRLFTAVYRGIPGACRNDGTGTASPSQG